MQNASASGVAAEIDDQDHKMLWDRLPSSMFEHFAFTLAPIKKPSPSEVAKSDTVAPAWAMATFGAAVCLSTVGFFVAQPELRKAFAKRLQAVAEAVEEVNAAS